MLDHQQLQIIDTVSCPFCQSGRHTHCYSQLLHRPMQNQVHNARSKLYYSVQPRERQRRRKLA